MSRSVITAAFFTISMTANVVATSAPSDRTACIPLKLIDEAKGAKYFQSLRVAGSYCLSANVRQKWRQPLNDFRDGLVAREAFVGTRTSHVSVNLRGYSLLSETPGWEGVKELTTGHSKKRPVRFVKIFNGTIDVGDEGIGIRLPKKQPKASLWIDFETEVTRHPPRGRQSNPHSVPESVRQQLTYLRNYEGSGYHIEDLTIRAGDFGVKLAGRGNIIRGNRIEVTNSKGAIYLFGPDNTIEDNIIIFRGKAGAASAAPIKIHQGERTIIRNNVIIVEADDNAPNHAISLIESADVTISGNRIYGVSNITQHYDLISSALLESNGTIKRRPALGPNVRQARSVR